MTDYQTSAALALAKCAAYDPWFPKASQAIVESWAEQLELHQLTTPDILAGVTKMYAENGSGFRPLPKDLTDAARAVRRDRRDRETEAQRRASEDQHDTELEAIWARNRSRLAQNVTSIGKAIPS